ncbi:MAG: family 10 glycosylhydrolase [Muribaculaceae bacterium]|nr:family 10 glycosylhydrolase [Muribaculaceae bacterium]
MFLSLLILALTSVVSLSSTNPKREFRGAWLHVIGQSQWQNKSTEQAKKYIRDQFDKLKDAGVNAVIFQVRPTADAVYQSKLEPWSSWLTGKRGKAPSPMWDPMEYAIEEAHKRGMEFHAWLNPYRVTSTAREVLPVEHISNKEPHRFFRYNGQILFDPAYQENRDFICEVIADILDRYDVDAIHIDDYFYPYPAAGKAIPDDKSYAKFGDGMNRGDWRRKNVDKLIEQMHSTIKDKKPWVRFGVSPFGIWRNKKSDPRGSESSGLQNYDDLYADVLLWAEKGWIDYLVPQLYWNLDTKAAPSRKLAQWWNDNVKGADLYIGQDVKRTMDVADPGNKDRNELDTKVKLSRKLPNVKGNVWWHGYWVTDNYKGAADSLAMKYQSTFALPPAYGDLKKTPKSVSNLKIVKYEGKEYLEWTAPSASHVPHESDIVRFAVYQFFPGETQDINEAESLVAVTPYNRVLINPEPGATYAVTALDRMNRESKPIFIYNKR